MAKKVTEKKRSTFRCKHEGCDFKGTSPWDVRQHYAANPKHRTKTVASKPKAAGRRGRPRRLETLTVAQLQSELDAKKAAIAQQEQAEKDRLIAEIRALDGAPAPQKGTRRKSGKLTLPDTIEKVLKV